PDPWVSFTTTTTRFGAPGSTATSGSSRIRAPGPSSRTVRAPASGPAATTASATAATAAQLALSKLLLEPVDHLDRPRIDPAQDGEVQGHEVAQQHEREQALGRALALGLYDERGGGRRLDQGPRAFDALARAGVQVGVVEEHGREAPQL